MASARQVLQAIKGAVEDTLDAKDLRAGGVRPKVAVGWPPLVEVQNAIAQQRAIIGVYDRPIGPTQRTNAFKSHRIAVRQPAAAGVTVDASAASFQEVGDTVTVTFGGRVLADDAVAIILGQSGQTAAQVVTGTTRDTPETLANALADAIASDIVLSTWITASAVGPVLTLTSLVPLVMPMALRTANVGAFVTELKRETRHVQIVCWFASEADRQAIGDPIQGELARLRVNFGINIADGEWIRIYDEGDMYSEEEQLRDCYRRDFFVSAEYGVTMTDNAYEVLVTPVSFTALAANGEVTL